MLDDSLGSFVLVLREEREGAAPLHLLVGREHRLRHLNEPVQTQCIVDRHRSEIPSDGEERDLKMRGSKGQREREMGRWKRNWGGGGNRRERRESQGYTTLTHTKRKEGGEKEREEERREKREEGRGGEEQEEE